MNQNNNSDFTPEQDDSKHFTIKELLRGNVVATQFFKKNWQYILFLVVLALIYINNHFEVESLMKEHLQLTEELKELKYEAITTSSELMKKSRQSEVVQKVQENNLGLEVLTTPPKTVVVE
ncbi:MAG: hypothetical protein LBV41_03170 [Cytophagaceae bacterium]|jgi:hypothetical protein|nr:hypothetical protein [Cytophagaceae bacterium]